MLSIITAKDRELEQSVHEFKQQLEERTLLLAEFKSRALRAEVIFFIHYLKDITVNKQQGRDTGNLGE